MGASAIDRSNYTDINASTIDGWIEEGWEWGTPISHEKFMRAQMGDWSIVLTPTIPVPRAWFPKSLAGCHVLGLRRAKAACTTCASPRFGPHAQSGVKGEKRRCVPWEPR